MAAGPKYIASTILAFNDILNIEKAYEWDQKQILSFIDHVANYSYLYDTHPEDRDALKMMRIEILELCPPTGKQFVAPGLTPDQTIKRRANPMWDPNSPSKTSKFLLCPFLHKDIPFYGLFDILGLFLSSIGNAPRRATAQNFYLPLVALYGQWCKTINPDRSAPTMYNCTWIKSGPDQGKFFLGASFKGYASGVLSTGEWAEVLQEARFSLVNDSRLVSSGWTMKFCPVNIPNPTGGRYGNCAETYPFVFLLK
ncbi:hypothetical protein N7456_006773 [Penicillium angulare]|uniref:Uncharacterized protein n=1 Tax=Penicillium angulare TaxID=116970 RepID=A0A9W9FIB1_9EURO|nr:hypothetical protein N7456_006773 [Penicillium angulare]